MFKLESYVTPLLMGYIDKYVQLKQEDFQLSLWGGDVVLNKLDLRLDVIEQALMLPVTIKSGFVHELRIHVPWTRLYSEPVVITINTIECILMVNRNLGDAASSATMQRNPSTRPASHTTRPQTDADADNLPPGYLQSLINKILHNMNVVINNLILKFVEDDIVLSLNVKSAECYSVISDWSRAFVELSLPELALRRVIDFHDLTLCLDKRNASGKIETYQDPMLYRCSLTCRLHMLYESINGKLPIKTVLNILNEHLDVSFTDIQLPMFRRLIDLCIALYSGVFGSVTVTEPVTCVNAKSDSSNVNDSVEQTGQHQSEGWASWAWSYVPALTLSGDTPDPDGGSDQAKKKPESPILVIGMYIAKATVLFKQTQAVKKRHVASSSSKSSSPAFRPFLIWITNGICLELVMKDISFFDMQIGMTDSQICSVLNDITKQNVFFKSGMLDTPKLDDFNFMSGSLFSTSGSETREYVFEHDAHMKMFNESYALQRFGCFWMNYLFTAQRLNDNNESNENLPETNDLLERSCIRYIIGPTQATVSTGSMQRVRHIIDRLMEFDYDPYEQVQEPTERPARAVPSLSDIQKLEGNISSVSYDILVIRPQLSIEPYNPGRSSDVNTSKVFHHDTRNTETSSPGIIVEAERIEFSGTRAMYDRRVAEIGSMLPDPSEQLMHNCHSHTTLRLCQHQAYLAQVNEWPMLTCLSNIIRPFDVTLSMRQLLFPKCWKNVLQPRKEYFFDVESFAINVTKAQVLLLTHILWSWTLTDSYVIRQITEISLVEDIFHTAVDCPVNAKQAVIELQLFGLHIQYMITEVVHAAAAEMSSIMMFVLRDETMRKCTSPVLRAPMDVTHVCSQRIFVDSSTDVKLDSSKTFLTVTYQMPRDLRAVQAPALLYLTCSGLMCNLDPAIHEWFAYIPSVSKQTSSASTAAGELPAKWSQPTLTVDSSIASASVPQYVQDSHLSESEHESIPTLPISGSSISVPQITPKIPSANMSHPIESESMSENKITAQQGDSTNAFAEFLTQLFPYMKIVHLQIEIDAWCLCVPSKHICCHEPTVDIYDMLRILYDRRSLPDTLIFCTPSISVSSSSHKQTHTINQRIPVRALDQSLAGDKLPWLLRFQNCSAYSVHSSQNLLHLLKPTSLLCGTLAVTAKYRNPMSDVIAQLNWCFHADMSSLLIACSSAQILLFYGLAMHFRSSVTNLMASFDPVAPIKKDAGREEVVFPRPVNKTEPLTSTASVSADRQDRFPISESSEKLSFEMLRDRKPDDASGGEVKLTFWLQWTLLKLIVKLFGHDLKCNNICGLVKMEDLTLSVDVHKVFSKVKCIIGAMHLNHLSLIDGKWQVGDFEGLLLSSTEQLTRSTRIVLPPSLIPSRSSRHLSAGDDSRNFDQQASTFLSIIFTRALAKNVQHKLKPLNDFGLSSKPVADDNEETWLNEICLTFQPFDMVANLTVITSLVNILTLASSSDIIQPKVSTAAESGVCRPLVSSQSLPLLYVNTSSIRLFVPCIRDVNSSFSHDVCVMQCASLTVTPHADNPLPRLVVDANAYSRVQEAITSVPGSDVEDRQYAVMVLGINVATASWSELVSKQNRNAGNDNVNDLKSQNPALEWNLKSKVESIVDEEVIIMPLLASFDLDVTFAPPIAVKLEACSRVICGYSVEVNLTTDVNVIMNIDQMKLLADICEYNLSGSAQRSSTSSGVCKGSATVSASRQKIEPGMLDSGIDTQSSSNIFIPEQNPNDLSGHSLYSNTPCDLLVTARRVSVMLYCYEIEDTRENCETNSTGDSMSKTSYENLDCALSTVKIVPFVYANIAQPHLVIKLHTSQKAELAIYDLIVKGSFINDYRKIEEDRIVPDVSDYPVFWVDTRSGKPDSHTGLLPNLITVQIVADNSLTQSVAIDMRLERPLALKTSLAKFHQIGSFCDRLSATFCSRMTKDNSNDQQSSQSPERQRSMNEQVYSSSLSLCWLRRVSIQTTQLALLMETMSVSKDDIKALAPVSIQFALSKINATVQLDASCPGQLQQISSHIKLQNCLLKISINGCYKYIINPMTPRISFVASWIQHSGSSDWPQLRGSVNCSCIQIQLGPDRVCSLQMFCEHVHNYFMACTTKSAKISDCLPNRVKQKTSLKKFADQSKLSTDDLKNGSFEYITKDCQSLPNPGEIAFHTDTASGFATMTWRYCESRVVSSLEVSPVPFNLQNSNQCSPDGVKVLCLLQCSQTLNGHFCNYAEFYLSENSSFQVKLPELSGCDNNGRVVATDIWRILIRYPKFDIDTETPTDPVVSPFMLAASVRVSSCFIRSLVPAIQFSVNLARVRLGLIKNFSRSEVDNWSSLHPFHLLDSMPDHEIFVINVCDTAITASSFDHQLQKFHATCRTHVECDVLEYRNLTLRPLLKRCCIQSRLELIPRERTQTLSIEIQIDKLRVRVGQSSVWTLNQVVNSWNSSKMNLLESNLVAYYVICNDTHSTIHLGQVDTDECINLPSRCAVQYCWRTYKCQPRLRITLADVQLETCPGIDLDKNDVLQLPFTNSAGQQGSVVVSIQNFSNVQKRIIVSGKFAITNLLNQSLDVKFSATPGSFEFSCNVHANDHLPSYVVRNSSNVPSLKVRLAGVDTVWSQEINVASPQNGQLVKLQSSCKKNVIHVWCHVIEQHYKRVTQTLVVFSPLFVINSQLPTALLVNIESSVQSAISCVHLDGRGSENQLLLSGGSAVHCITFQLSPMMPASSPAVRLSADTIEQVSRKTLEPSADLFTTCAKLCEPSSNCRWPYNARDKSGTSSIANIGTNDISSIINVNSSMINSIDSRSIPAFEQPNIDLQVNLLQRSPQLNTLLIDVVPCWLFVNTLCFDVILTESNSQSWSIPAGKSFAPPVFKEQFSIGIVVGGHLHRSSWISLSEEDDQVRYVPQYEGLLYMEGHLQLSIPVTQDGVIFQTCSLLLRSAYKHQMRILTVQERISFCNQQPRGVEILCISAAKYNNDGSVAQGYKIPDSIDASIVLSDYQMNQMQPLLLWNVMSSNKHPTLVESTVLEFAHYIRIRFKENREKESSIGGGNTDGEKRRSKWSLPVRLNASETGKRLFVAIPVDDNGIQETVACSISGIIDSATVHLVLTEDAIPSMQINNNSKQTLYFGQEFDDPTSRYTACVIHEQLELLFDIPSVSENSKSHYMLPSIADQFPSIDIQNDQKLRLGAADEEGVVHWGRGVNLDADNSVFVTIPPLFDIKVCVKKLGHTLHVNIDPVSRAEITAKEVRSRLNKKVIIETSASLSPSILTSPRSSQPISPVNMDKSPTLSVIQLKRENDKLKNMCLQVICSAISFVILNESSEPFNSFEFLRLTMDKVGLSYYPTLDIVNSTSSCPLQVHNFLVSIYDMQIDNQMFETACYDFPVSFVKQAPTNIDFRELSEIEMLSIKEQISFLQSRSLICLSGELCCQDSTGNLSLQSLRLSVQPFRLFLEDAYAWDLLKVIDKLIPVWTTPRPYDVDASTLPFEIQFLCDSLSSPLTIQHICIEPINMLVSFRATLKMFIATNGAPLTFNRFEKKNICTTKQQLVKSLTVHYATAALFRAGHVVGSLELLGNPTGFVRHIGDGVADMFCMPYRGLTVGPGAFLSGITHGIASITHHLSVGTLTSVSNFASSLSRNMEHLSLDADHIHRSELMRKRRTSGLSDGLKNGLTGFGLSLLGAIAGIADQPLQVFTRNQSESASTVSHAKGILTGFGKGLVGVVTKPIGGAAELVSQTSLGMLHEVGIKDAAVPRHKSSTKSQSMFRAGTAKFADKFVRFASAELNSDADILVSISALASSSHIPKDCTLVLTADNLFIICETDDQLIITLPIAEIDSHRLRHSPLVVRIIHMQMEQQRMVDTQQARIAAFLGNSTSLSLGVSDRDTQPCGSLEKVLSSSVDHMRDEEYNEYSALDAQSMYEFKIAHLGDADLFFSQFMVNRNAAIKQGFVL